MAGADAEGVCREGVGKVELQGGGVPGTVGGVRDAEGGGFHGGGVGVSFCSVGVAAFVVDGFQPSGSVALGDEVEAVGGVAVGKGCDAFDAACGFVAMPGVDVVHGVVGHFEELAARGGEADGAVGFFEDGAAGDAAFRLGDVVGEDG